MTDLTPEQVNNGWIARFFRRFGLWRCDVLDRHKRPHKITIDEWGVDSEGQCPRCGRNVMLDSQGNWYSLTRTSQ